MLTAFALLAFYGALTLWMAYDHRKTQGESLWSALWRHKLDVALLVLVWTPALFAGGYWFVTGRSALALIGW